MLFSYQDYQKALSLSSINELKINGEDPDGDDEKPSYGVDTGDEDAGGNEDNNAGAEDAPAATAEDDEPTSYSIDDPGDEEETTPTEDDGGDDNTVEGEDTPEDNGEEAPPTDATEDDGYDVDNGGDDDTTENDGDGEDAAGGEEGGADTPPPAENGEDGGNDDGGYDVGGGDSGDSTEDSGEDNGGNEGEAKASNSTGSINGSPDDTLNKVEDDIFSELTPEQRRIQELNLKTDFSKLYDDCVTYVDRINKLDKNEKTLEVLDKTITSLISLKQYIYSYITDTFDTKTYFENQCIYQKCLVCLAAINNVLEELAKDTNSDIANPK